MANEWMTRLWDWVDARAVVRRILLAVVLWMTWRATQWAMAFATATKLGGGDTALVIGAVTAPVVALMGYVFRVYADTRKESGDA